MLVWLAEYLTQYYSGFNVFSYLTLRAILGIFNCVIVIALFRSDFDPRTTAHANWPNGS